MNKQSKILIVQRVITPYRLELLSELKDFFSEVCIVTSSGQNSGTLKKAVSSGQQTSNIKIKTLRSLKLNYSGESRNTKLFLYPQILNLISDYDVILLEGTTNIINNVYIIPYARILQKKIIWWDSGYALDYRTVKRKIIDFVMRPFIKLTHLQMAYSNKGASYMKKHMGAKNVFVNLNTINTRYFEKIQNQINYSISNYQFNKYTVKLLYVGVVEPRKKIKELIEIIIKLNKMRKKQYYLSIIGGGESLSSLKTQYSSGQIQFHGPIYDKETLKTHYFNSDLFVLPGDGGLGILQSLLYGLPVLCIRGADGTELDYIKNKKFLLKDFEEIYPFLLNFNGADRKNYFNYSNLVSSKKWIENLTSKIIDIK